MRAASALAILADNSEDARDQVSSYIQELTSCPDSRSDQVLMWLAVEPVFKKLLVERHAGHMLRSKRRITGELHETAPEAQPLRRSTSEEAHSQFHRATSSLGVEITTAPGPAAIPKAETSPLSPLAPKYDHDLAILHLALAEEENELDALLQIKVEDGRELRCHLVGHRGSLFDDLNEGAGHHLCARCKHTHLHMYNHKNECPLLGGQCSARA